MERRIGLVARLLFGIALALAFVLGVTPASAGGRAKLTDAAPQEDDGRWSVEIEIDYGRVPDLPTVPMVFSFKPTAIYERVVTDDSPEKPIERTKPLQNQPTIDLDMDVDFADASGKLFKLTKFKFKLSRKNDFQAGEYELVITDSRAGSKIGTPIRLSLKGANKVIDLKSMVFTAEPPKRKVEAKSEGGQPTQTTAAEDMGPDLSDIGEQPNQPPPGTASPQKSGGGCALGAPAVPGAGLFLLALGLVLVRRRR